MVSGLKNGSKAVCSTHAMKGGKIMIEELKHKFDSLGDEEKIEFMKLIIPSFREIFSMADYVKRGEYAVVCLRPRDCA